VHCSAWPAIGVSPALVQHADERIRNSQQITTRKLASELSESRGSGNNITDALGY
jgi:hypothetical protein